MKRILCILLWVAPIVTGEAQDFSFYHLTQHDGLTSNQYNSFVKMDSRNLIWIGSLEGMACYDGRTMRLYTAQDGIYGGYIQSAVFEDREGNLWFSTYQAINCYRRKEDRFRHYQLCSPAGQLIEEGYRVFHVQRADNRLWVKAGDYIYDLNLLNPEEDHIPLPFEVEGEWFAADTTAAGAPVRIYGSLWSAGKGMEVLSRNREGNWTYARYWDRASAELPFPPPTVYGAVANGASLCWFYTDLGLIRFDPEQPRQPRLFPPPPGRKLELRSCVQYAPTLLLVSSRDDGLWGFDLRENAFDRNWRNTGQNDAELASNALRELYLDPQRRLWVSHAKHGLDFSRPPRHPFRNPLNVPAAIVSMLADDKGDIWAASEKQGVFVFSADGAFIRQISAPPADQIKQICQSHEGAVWALGREGIYQYNPAANNWMLLLESDSQIFSLTRLPGGRTLAATSKGIMDVRATDEGLRLLSSPEFDANAGLHFSRMFRGADRTLYLPFQSTELWVLRSEEDVLHHIRSIETNADILGVCEDRKRGLIWLGTSGGLACLDHNLQFRRVLQEKWQIGVRPVYEIHQDSGGLLWISSNNGLWRYDPGSGKLAHFLEEDGITSNEFTQAASAAAGSGALWFGNTRGITVFHPDSITPYPYAPRVRLSQLLVNNAPYREQGAVNETARIRLRHFQHTLAFELVAVGYHRPGESRLRYRLVSYDDNWTVVENGDYARFSQLRPGSYRLEVIAANANGVESSPRSLDIRIIPPFWQRWWFRLAVIAAAGLSIFGAVQEYIRRKLRKQQILLERERALQKERGRIADELHDDLGGGLSVILLLSEHVREQEQDQERRRSLDRIYQSAKESLENMSDIIWILDRGNNTLEDLLIYMRRHATEFLTANNLRRQLLFPETVPVIELTGERRRNILLILKESLHNIVKHARASSVEIGVVLEERVLIVTVRDDGAGLGENPGRPGGKGLSSMQRRAESIGGQLAVTSRTGEGTSVRLTVPLLPLPASREGRGLTALSRILKSALFYNKN